MQLFFISKTDKLCLVMGDYYGTITPYQHKQLETKFHFTYIGNRYDEMDKQIKKVDGLYFAWKLRRKSQRA